MDGKENEKVKRIAFALSLAMAAAMAVGAAAQDEAQRRRLVGQADYYVREFEREVVAEFHARETPK